MLLLYSNTQRQGVLMAPDGPCVSPRTVSSCTTKGFLAIVTPATIMGHGQSMEKGGRWMLLVWVLWKDVWNRSMGIKGLGSVGGLLCWRLSPLPASMISSIDTEVVLCSLCVFRQPLSHCSTSLSLTPLHSVSLNLSSSALFLLWVKAKESGESSSLLSELTGFILIPVNSNDDRSLQLCFTIVSTATVCI